MHGRSAAFGSVLNIVGAVALVLCFGGYHTTVWMGKRERDRLRELPTANGVLWDSAVGQDFPETSDEAAGVVRKAGGASGQWAQAPNAPHEGEEQEEGDGDDPRA